MDTLKGRGGAAPAAMSQIMTLCQTEEGQVL